MAWLSDVLSIVIGFKLNISVARTSVSNCHYWQGRFKILNSKLPIETVYGGVVINIVFYM